MMENKVFTAYLFILHIVISSADIVIETFLPVNPVKTGGILSLHCQIWNLEPNHQVQIFRKLSGKHSEMVSVGEYVLQDIEDRVFLASKQIDDGSSVYFLSVTDITNSDQGTYSCKVTRSNEDDDTITLARSVVNVDVYHFPTDTYPVCSPNAGITLTEGIPAIFNCSSEISNPIPDLTWVQTGVGEIKNGVTKAVNGGIVYSEVRFIPTFSDKGKMFLCELSSPIFPEIRQSCHIGPTEVLRNPNHVYTPVIKDTADVAGDVLVTPNIGTTLTVKNKCLKSCSSAHVQQFFWIIATIVAAFFALTFLLIGVILIIKYNRMSRRRCRQFPPNLHREYIYSELEHKPSESQMYMSLDKRTDKLTGPPCLEQVKGHYHVASY